MSAILWEDVVDGEYGEIKANVNGHVITIYSDRDGNRWSYYLDDDESVGPFHTKERAQREAIADAQGS